MPKGKKVSQDLKDKMLEKVALYQSEQKMSVKRSCEVVGSEYGIKPDTISKWYYRSRGKNLVMTQVAKKKEKEVEAQETTAPTAIAATSVSSVDKIEAEKIIFDYVKSLSLFKRILACIIGIDKLCWNYGNIKKMD